MGEIEGHLRLDLHCHFFSFPNCPYDTFSSLDVTTIHPFIFTTIRNYLDLSVRSSEMRSGSLGGG